MRPAKTMIWLAVVLQALFSLESPATAAEPGDGQKFASAEAVEGFRGRSFMLGDNDQVALVRALDWDKDRYIKLPFWLGTGQVAQPALRPAEGRYYVISEAYIVRKLGGNEWLIRAGSSLQKPDAVLVTSKTRYKKTGMILPTIVQYVGKRTFTRTDNTKLDLAVLHEVSLPMKWTSGRTPLPYAPFTVVP